VLRSLQELASLEDVFGLPAIVTDNRGWEFVLKESNHLETKGNLHSGDRNMNNMSQ
jgi:hypothetical protein